jgi:hypothetical protein
MMTTMIKRGALAAGLAATFSMAAVTSGSAAPRWHGGGVAIGAGIAGFALGAAAAAPYYGYAPYGYGGYPYGYGGYYDYAPDAVAVAPGPYYAAPYDYGYRWRRQRECHFGISGC